MESCSLHEFLGQFEKEKCSNKKDVQLKLKALNYALRRRKDKQYTVTHQHVNPHQSHENKELHFYHMLKLTAAKIELADITRPRRDTGAGR